jgi:hypothetical protein
VLDRRKAFDRPPAYTLSWRVRGDQLRVSPLELLEFAEQGVKFRIRNFGGSSNVVKLFVAADIVPKLLDAPGGLHQAWGSWLWALGHSGLQTCRRHRPIAKVYNLKPEVLSIAGEQIVWQREQRVALG